MNRGPGTGRRFGAARSLVPFAGLLLATGLALLPFVGPVAAEDASMAPASLAPASMAPASVVPASVVPASMPPASTEPEGAAIPVTLVDFAIKPADIEAAGTTLTFDVVNEGPTPHNLTIRDAAGTVLGATRDLSRGETTQLVVTVPGPGTYVTFCSLPGHESLGVVGELVVTDGAAPAASPSMFPAASPSASPPA